MALWGIANSIIPYGILRFVLSILPIRKDRLALAKLLAGALIFLGAWGVQTGFVAGFLSSALGGPWGALLAIGYGLSLPPTALVALRWVTEARLHRLSRGGLKAMFRHSERIEALKREREELKQELATLRDRYLASVGSPGPELPPGGAGKPDGG